MFTKLENDILDNCGWKEKEKTFYGMLIYDVVSDNNKNLMKVITHLNEIEIKVIAYAPDIEGEKMTLVFSRENQTINRELSDNDIAEIKDMEAMLSMIKNMIIGTKSIFMPIKKIKENTPSFKI